MVNFRTRWYLFTAIALVTFLTIGLPAASIAKPKQISFAATRNLRPIESRIEIGGAIYNLPNYQTPESCEDVEIKYADVKGNALATTSIANDPSSPKSNASTPSTASNRCRYLLQVPRRLAGKQISISISPTDRSEASRSIVFVVPNNVNSSRAIAGPTFEF